jgi:hypothetical protein
MWTFGSNTRVSARRSTQTPCPGSSRALLPRDELSGSRSHSSGHALPAVPQERARASPAAASPRLTPPQLLDTMVEHGGSRAAAHRYSAAASSGSSGGMSGGDGGAGASAEPSAQPSDPSSTKASSGAFREQRAQEQAHLAHARLVQAGNDLVNVLRGHAPALSIRAVALAARAHRHSALCIVDEVPTYLEPILNGAPPSTVRILHLLLQLAQWCTTIRHALLCCGALLPMKVCCIVWIFPYIVKRLREMTGVCRLHCYCTSYCWLWACMSAVSTPSAHSCSDFGHASATGTQTSLMNTLQLHSIASCLDQAIWALQVLWSEQAGWKACSPCFCTLWKPACQILLESSSA